MSSTNRKSYPILRQMNATVNNLNHNKLSAMIKLNYNKLNIDEINRNKQIKKS